MLRGAKNGQGEGSTKKKMAAMANKRGNHGEGLHRTRGSDTVCARANCHVKSFVNKAREPRSSLTDGNNTKRFLRRISAPRVDDFFTHLSRAQ